MAAPLVGKRVQITGLSARPDLNGKIGIAESYNHDTDRYVVCCSEWFLVMTHSWSNGNSVTNLSMTEWRKFYVCLIEILRLITSSDIMILCL